jgi:hypothetical protein
MKHAYRFAKESFGSEIEGGVLKLIGTSLLGPTAVKSESSWNPGIFRSDYYGRES